MQSIEEKRNYFIALVQKDIVAIDSIKEKIENSGENSNRYSTMLNNRLRVLRYHESCIKYMRENNEEELKHRREILATYADIIDKIIPDDIPIVFHGTNNIGVVEQILKSGGLLTPADRNEDYTSFATQIDVTSKSNINTSLEFASPVETSYMPYGAIFAFLPRKEEYKEVLQTKKSTEVFGGVSGVNFISEPDRLIGIITTEENIDRIKKWCLKYGIDPEKVYTHESFAENCQKIDFSLLINPPSKRNRN